LFLLKISVTFTDVIHSFFTTGPWMIPGRCVILFYYQTLDDLCSVAHSDSDGLAVTCVTVHSVGNMAAMLRRTVVNKHLDVFGL